MASGPRIGNTVRIEPMPAGTTPGTPYTPKMATSAPAPRSVAQAPVTYPRTQDSRPAPLLSKMFNNAKGQPVVITQPSLSRARR
jgi:hypothetical protein